MTKNTIDWQYTEGVELYCQLLLEKIFLFEGGG